MGRFYNTEKPNHRGDTSATELGWYFGITRQRADQIIHPKKAKARRKLQDAIKNGLLVRPDKCEGCGRQGKTLAHHENYNYPLDVQWYCRSCHDLAHIRPQPVRFAVNELPHLMKQRQHERELYRNNRVVEIQRCVGCGTPRKITENHKKTAARNNKPNLRCQSCNIRQVSPSKKNTKGNTTCGHMEVSHRAFGMCQPCYSRHYYTNKKAKL